MLDTPHVVQSAQQRTAVVRLTVPRAQIQSAFGPAVSELTAALAAQGITPGGPRFSHHLKMPGEMFDLEVGVPVERAVTPSGRVSASTLPARRVARTVYHGGMEGLGAAWGELGAWVAAQGHTGDAFIWEKYLVGPELSADPSTWQTELNWPLAD